MGTQPAALLAGAVTLVALAACGGGNLPSATTPPASTTPASTTPASTTPMTATTGAASPSVAARTVTATLTDYKIVLSQASFPPGAYAFVAEQKGQHPHALSIKGPGIDGQSTSTIQPGGASQDLAVALQPGAYELWCPVGNHKALGMVVTITVQ